MKLILKIYWYLPVFYGGNGVCKMVKFGQMVGPYLSSYVLIMTAIDRFQVHLMEQIKPAPDACDSLESLKL